MADVLSWVDVCVSCVVVMHCIMLASSESNRFLLFPARKRLQVDRKLGMKLLL